MSGESANQQSATRALGPMVSSPVVRHVLRPLLTYYRGVAYVREAAAVALRPSQPEACMVPPLGALLDEHDQRVATAAYLTLSDWAKRVGGK